MVGSRLMPRGICLAIVLSCLSEVASADLEPRLGGLALYDTDRNITILADAAPALSNDRGIPNTNGRMMHFDARQFIDALNAEQLLGVSGWRLPNAAVPDPNCTDITGTIPTGNNTGYNCTGGELGHLFYDELGGVAGANISTSTDPNRALIQNLRTGGAGDSTYWTGTFSVIGDLPYALSFNNGQQLFFSPVNEFWVWPVLDGDISGGVTLELSKQSNVDVVNINSPFTYIFFITASSGDATNVVLTDVLPEGVLPDGPINLACTTQNVGTQIEISCDLGTISVGTTVEVRVDVIAPGEPVTLTNTAFVTADELPLPVSDTHSVSVAVDWPDLSASKIGPTEALVGMPFTYTLIAGNEGPGDSTGAMLVDELPPSVSFVSADSDDAVCGYDSSLHQVTCDLDVVVINAVGGEILVYLTVIPNEVNVIRNSVTIEGVEFDPVPENNTSPPVVTNVVLPDLSIRDTLNVPTDLLLDFGNVVIGEQSTANVIITNTGSSPLARVIIGSPVSPALPFGITVDSCFGMTLVGGALPPESCQFTAQFAPTATGVYEQVIELPLSSPATGTVIARIRLTGVGVARQADIEITKTADKIEISPQDTVTFTITVRNVAGLPAPVRVRDRLPSPLELVSFHASVGNYIPATGFWDVGELVPGDPPAVLRITAFRDYPAGVADPCIENTATAEITDRRITEASGDTPTATVALSLNDAGCADIKLTSVDQKFDAQVPGDELGQHVANMTLLLNPTPDFFKPLNCPVLGGCDDPLTTLLSIDMGEVSPNEFVIADIFYGYDRICISSDNAPPGLQKQLENLPPGQLPQLPPGVEFIPCDPPLFLFAGLLSPESSPAFYLNSAPTSGRITDYRTNSPIEVGFRSSQPGSDHVGTLLIATNDFFEPLLWIKLTAHVKEDFGPVDWTFVVENDGPAGFLSRGEFSVALPDGASFLGLDSTAPTLELQSGEFVTNVTESVYTCSARPGRFMREIVTCFINGVPDSASSPKLDCGLHGGPRCGIRVNARVVGTSFTGGIHAAYCSISSYDPVLDNNLTLSGGNPLSVSSCRGERD